MINLTRIARRIVTLRTLRGPEVITEAEKERVTDLAVDLLEVIRWHARKVTKSEVGAALGVTALYIGEIEDWPRALEDRRVAE